MTEPTAGAEKTSQETRHDSYKTTTLQFEIPFTPNSFNMFSKEDGSILESEGTSDIGVASNYTSDNLLYV
jgi:hypothetical protein